MTISDEAVEAAARAAYDTHSFKYSTVDIKWDDLEPRFKAPWLIDATRALTAAAPFIAAQAYKAGHHDAATGKFDTTYNTGT